MLGPLNGTLISLTDWLNGLSQPGASAAQSTARSSLPPLYPSKATSQIRIRFLVLKTMALLWYLLWKSVLVRISQNKK
jgi:hypothetical protein